MKNNKDKKPKKFILFFNIIVIILSSIGIIYASVAIYDKISKNSEIYTLDDYSIVENDLNNLISQEEAINISLKTLNKLGFNKDYKFNIITLEKIPSESKVYWNLRTEENIEINIDAKTGKFSRLSDIEFDDLKIKSTLKKSDVEKIFQELYNVFDFSKEYKLISLEKNLITEDTSLWEAQLCVEYDGIPNMYEKIKIVFVPEVKRIKSLIIFDKPFENNPIVISKKDAINIAEKKSDINSDDIKNIVANIEIQEVNYSTIYGNNKNKEEMYKNSEIIRRVWSVEITVKGTKIDRKTLVCVDCTTGEVTDISRML